MNRSFAVISTFTLVTLSTAVLNLANLLDNAGFVQHVVAREWKYNQSGNYPSSFLDNSIFCKINFSSN